jgi:hypothetical protein
MSAVVTSRREVYSRALDHLLQRIDKTPAIDEPFSHFYLEDVFPQNLYERLLKCLPDPKLYNAAAERHYGKGGEGFTRAMLQLTPSHLAILPGAEREVWAGVAAALTAPEVKHAVYAKLAKDLAFRYSVATADVPELAGFARPTLYRETAGFEIPPHPDTRKKVVTMHLYLPADRSQLDLGTALYQRSLLSWPFGTWHTRFVKVKQFAFQPNSGYAFVVNNTFAKKSWHGREELPAGAGVRNTLLNTFYETPREEFASYAA